ncbi:MAG: dTDP-4-dehydrorhamnose reductase [Halopseudomonas sp.]
MAKTKVLIIGKNGQLGWELSQTQPDSIEALFCSRNKCDLANLAAAKEQIFAFAPDVIINAGAYTAVDQAETDQQACYAVNADGVKQLAEFCAEQQIKLIHISTDFVFSGDKGSPYLPDDATAPIGVYGASKREGEQAIIKALSQNATIIRTAWVYSQHGNNFVKTMLRLMKEKDQLGVICDQVGTPTHAKGLARLCWRVAEALTASPAEKMITGIHHWTDSGAASWYDFAMAIQRIGLELGLLERQIPIYPISTSQYPTPAKRPHYSVLDKTSSIEQFGVVPKHWARELELMLQAMATNQSSVQVDQANKS